MNIGFSSLYDALGKIFFEKGYNGDNQYTIEEAGVDWYNSTDNLAIAQNHPILTPALLYVSNLFAQAQFTIIDKATEEPILNHWLLELLKKPNYYQTQVDFLESAQFMKIARGVAPIYTKRASGFSDPVELYVLDYKLIKFPIGFKTPLGKESMISNTTVIYDEHGPQERKIKLKDIIFLYDLPNGYTKKNYFDNSSRLDGLKQTLFNTKDSETAKNIILKSNGKEMISADGNDGFSLDENEKKEAENMFNIGHGLSKTRSRSFITTKNIKWKSLHIALRDLGLDDSIKVDGNMIYTGLHIPKDILSLEAKKTTYNNYRESMTSYIQNDTQSQCNDFVASCQTLLPENEVLKGTYDHLPVMQFLEKERYEALSLRAKALDDLIKTGIPQELALVMCNFPKNLQLDEEARSTAAESAQSTTNTPKLLSERSAEDFEKQVHEIVEQYIN